MNQIIKLTAFLTLSVSLFLLSSCKRPSFINLTSTNISQNPSGIYTIQTEVDLQDRNILYDSIEILTFCPISKTSPPHRQN